MWRGLPDRTCFEWSDPVTCDDLSERKPRYKYLDIVLPSSSHLLQVGVLHGLNNLWQPRNKGLKSTELSLLATEQAGEALN